MKKLLVFCLLTSPLACLTGTPIPEQQVTSQNPLFEITQLHLSSLAMPIVQVKKEKTEAEKTFFEKITKLEEPEFIIPESSKYEQISLAYTLLAPYVELPEEKVANQNALKDLEVLAGNHTKANNLLNIFNRTHLPEGEVYLAELLTHPVTDIQELQKRQNIIKALVENPAMEIALDEALAEFKKHHTTFNSLWTAESKANSVFVDGHFWRWKFLEGLNTNSKYQHAVTSFNLFVQPATSILPMALMQGLITYPVITTPELRSNPVEVGSAVFANAYVGFITYILAQSVKKNFDALNYLQGKAISVASLVRTIDAAQKAIELHPELQELDYADVLAAFSKGTASVSSKMRRLVTLLRTNTFKNEPSVFSLQGRVKVAYALIEQIKDELAPALVALGELDAYLSCAKLYKEFENKDNKFVFAQYITSNSPSITMDAMWNPFVGSEKSVVNSIEFGKSNPRNMILTGPNAGGKSTFAKGLTLNVFLAQTIGMVPAKSFALTPFAKINTYMNISDDTAGGNSLFKSEVMRAQELIDTIKSLPSKKFSFSVMDEMFSGTSPKEGEAATYAVADDLMKQSNSILILATHFQKLKELESTTTLVKNYQVRVVRYEDGSFSYPFKLEEGAADQNVAIDILKQEGFSSSILDKAYQILQN